MASSCLEDDQQQPLPSYFRPEHTRIARLLRMMKSDFLTEAGCWFGGGTAIVMTHGEYRLSLDVDFLCSSQDGYRALRQAVTAKGCAGIVAQPVKQLRDFRCDQYGLRTAIEVDGQPIKLEIVREGRIDLTGAYDRRLGCTCSPSRISSPRRCWPIPTGAGTRPSAIATPSTSAF